MKTKLGDPTYGKDKPAKKPPSEKMAAL